MDSMPNCTSAMRPQFLTIVDKYLRSVYAEFRLPFTSFQVRDANPNPLQTNGYDCGLHVVWNIYYAAQNKALVPLPPDARKRWGECLLAHSFAPMFVDEEPHEPPPPPAQINKKPTRRAAKARDSFFVYGDDADA